MPGFKPRKAGDKKGTGQHGGKPSQRSHQGHNTGNLKGKVTRKWRRTNQRNQSQDKLTGTLADAARRSDMSEGTHTEATTAFFTPPL